MTEFGLRMKQIREKRGMTCTALAEQIGITPQGLSNIENGNNGRTFEKLPRIAKALGCRIDDLFPEMDDAPSPEEGKTDSADGFDDDSLDALAL